MRNHSPLAAHIAAATPQRRRPARTGPWWEPLFLLAVCLVLALASACVVFPDVALLLVRAAWRWLS